MTQRQVEAIWVFKYTKSQYKALYGRRLQKNGDQSYTKDFLQVSGECQAEFERVIGRELAEHDEERFVYRWPHGSESDGKIKRTTDRLNFRWPTRGIAPAPWRMALNITPNSLETFEGDPDLETVAEANAEWERYESLQQDPWLVVVKLKEEPRTLHLRAYLGNPPDHLQHCSTQLLPAAVQEAIDRAGHACRVVSLDALLAPADDQTALRIWFDPERNHDAFSVHSNAEIAARSDAIDYTSFAPLTAVERTELSLEVVGRDLPESVDHALQELDAHTERAPELKEGLVPQERRNFSRSRSMAFRIAVRRAYGGRCAVCGSSLITPAGIPEAQAAHIYPKSLDGSDDPRNGILLCSMHHWAFDAGWFSISDGFQIMVREDTPENADYAFIRSMEGDAISLPAPETLRPHSLFLREHRKLHGFE